MLQQQMYCFYERACIHGVLLPADQVKFISALHTFFFNNLVALLHTFLYRQENSEYTYILLYIFYCNDT